MKRAAKRKPLPRPWRIVLCLLACLVLLCFAWFAEGMPALSAESALRRAERQALVPMDGEILANVPHRSYNRDNARLLAVEYGDAAAGFFCAVRNNGFPNAGWNARYDGAYYLAPKSQAGATVMAFPGAPSYAGYGQEALLIAVFDEYSAAVRAELTFTLVLAEWLGFGDAGPHTYALEAEREHRGAFFFLLEEQSPSESSLTAERYALESLANLADPWGRSNNGVFAGGIPVATVAFYDAAGNVIATVETEFARALV